jgi:hypothetical protein
MSFAHWTQRTTESRIQICCTVAESREPFFVVKIKFQNFLRDDYRYKNLICGTGTVQVADLSWELNYSLKQGCGSGSGLDPDSETLWIRIPNTDPGARQMNNTDIFDLIGLKFWFKKSWERNCLRKFCFSLDPDPELDPDPDWAKMLDPDPYSINPDLQPWFKAIISQPFFLMRMSL